MGSDGGGGGSRTEPLATHKLLMSEEQLDGKDDKQTLEDWFSNVDMKVNLVYPGAKKVLDWAAAETEEITPTVVSRRPDAGMACYTLSISHWDQVAAALPINCVTAPGNSATL